MNKMVKIHCPVCEAKNVQAKVQFAVTQKYLFYVIPLEQVRRTYVHCSACNSRLDSEVHYDEITKYTAEQLVGYIHPGYVITTGIYAVLTLISGAVFPAGFIFFLGGLAICKPRGGWRMVLIWLSLPIQLIATLIFIIYKYTLFVDIIRFFENL
ncbi:hypothetical protein JD969_07545 [Planctomycetota bacterium]|nr:hypothetical protein JD969_07545 [Planctomycetota bacterium]